MAKQMIKVVHWSIDEITHAFASAAMVYAINESCKVQGHEPSFWKSCGLAIFGQAAPVSIDVASPAKLRDRRDQIIRENLLPYLKDIRKQSNADISAWMRRLQTDKIIAIGEIQSKFDYVRKANKNMDQTLLAGQRVCVALERSAMIAEALIPAGALMLGAPAAIMGVEAVSSLVLAGTAASFGHFVARAIADPRSGADFMVWEVKTLIGVVMHAHGERAIEGAEYAEKAAISREIGKTLQTAGEDLARDPAFAKFMQESAKKKAAAAIPAALGWGAIVLVAGYEVFEQLKEARKDWYAGTPQAEPEEEPWPRPYQPAAARR